MDSSICFDTMKLGWVIVDIKGSQVRISKFKMKKVNKQCLLDTPRTVRVSEKTWQVIVQTRRP